MQIAKQQRAHSAVRKTALACLKELMPLLCGGEQLSQTRPHVHAQLLLDMTGARVWEVASSRTPHLLRTPQAAKLSSAGQVR